MCNKNEKDDNSTVSLKGGAARRTRTKTRKPKFLSLRLELFPDQSSMTTTHHRHKQQRQHPQLNLFPLHPENLVEDKDMAHEQDEHVALLFDSATESTTATLHGLLDVKSTTTTTTTATVSSEGDPISPSITYAYMGGQDSEDGGGAGATSLVRTAMRCKGREASEEKWVSYSKVVEKKEQEEVSSHAAAAATAQSWAGSYTPAAAVQVGGGGGGCLTLKLDYQGILNAWSDKGPLYIEGESPPQTVPDLHDNNSNVVMDGWGGGGLWGVPEISGVKAEEERGGSKEGWRQREARVMRYKEKRQSRLFSKRIRYEVRKLNAEKRPRLKGRFVKINGEEV